jgi:hypothetical protein
MMVTARWSVSFDGDRKTDGVAALVNRRSSSNPAGDRRIRGTFHPTRTATVPATVTAPDRQS